MRTTEQVVWIVLACILGIAEFRAIDKQDRDSQARQDFMDARARYDFRLMTKGLTDSMKLGQKQFNNTVSHVDEVATLAKDSIKTQTGGDSFAFITLTAEPAQAFQVQIQHFAAPKGVPYFLVLVTSHGKYPLRGTQAIMMDDDRRIVAVEEYNKHPTGDWITAIKSTDNTYQIPYLRPQSAEAPQGEVDLLGLYPMPEGDSKKDSL